eukprot:s257_g40.t1
MVFGGQKRRRSRVTFADARQVAALARRVVAAVAVSHREFATFLPQFHIKVPPWQAAALYETMATMVDQDPINLDNTILCLALVSQDPPKAEDDPCADVSACMTKIDSLGKEDQRISIFEFIRALAPRHVTLELQRSMIREVLKRVWVCRPTLLSALGARDPEATNKVDWDAFHDCVREVNDAIHDMGLPVVCEIAAAGREDVKYNEFVHGLHVEDTWSSGAPILGPLAVSSCTAWLVKLAGFLPCATKQEKNVRFGSFWHLVILVLKVGNKRDLKEERQVSFLEASRFAQEKDILFLETSALTGENVQDVFHTLAQRILNKVEEGICDIPESRTGGQSSSDFNRMPDRSDRPRGAGFCRCGVPRCMAG